MPSGRSGGQSPSGLWVCRHRGSRRPYAGATTPPMTPTSSGRAATGGSAPTKTVWSLPTREACRTGAASPTMWTPLSGTFMVRNDTGVLGFGQSPHGLCRSASLSDNKRHLFCSSFRLRPLYPRTTVLEIRPGGHELAGGLPSLCRRGFFWL